MEELIIFVDVPETIRFFDKTPEYSIGQATSVGSVGGATLDQIDPLAWP